MRKLTQRERMLIYIAVVLMLLTGGYYLVKLPSDMKRMETDSQLRILQLQERGTDEEISGKSVLEQEIDEKLEQADKNSEDYLPYQSNSLLIPEIANHLTSFGIIPESLEVVNVSALEEKDAPEKGYSVYKATVRVVASGTTEDLYRMLDWTCDVDWISVTAYSGNDTESAAGPEEVPGITEEESTLTLTMTCLMLELKKDGQGEE